jgi:hypothetical protein
MFKGDKANMVFNITWFTLVMIGTGWNFIIPIHAWNLEKMLWIGIPIVLYDGLLLYMFKNKTKRRNNR